MSRANDIHFVSTLTELSSEALGGRVVSVSDEFFAEAFHLLKTEPAPSLKGQFGAKGALYSGWETRRHNPDHDWCIIQLGVQGCIQAVDIDTSHFNGNEAPCASIQALNALQQTTALTADDPRWEDILHTVDLGPNSRHIFRIHKGLQTQQFTHVKLKIYPDGGVARFRVYGLVTPVFPKNDCELFDLAYFASGGRVVAVSDQHFGVGSNLLLPGRGKDMGDGWETKRSRMPGHKDWALIFLGCPGFLDHVEIDTHHFMGNYPDSIEIYAIKSEEVIPAEDESTWQLILPRTKVGPHRRHFFRVENAADTKFTHARIVMYPDGGIKRIRIYGWRTKSRGLRIPNGVSSQDENVSIQVDGNESTDEGGSTALRRQPSVSITALPLTHEAFSSFGSVIQAYTNENAVPRDMKVTGANQGTALKYHHTFTAIQSCFPSGTSSTPKAGFSVYRATPPVDALPGEDFPVKLLERHPYNNQAFFAIGNGAAGKLWENDLEKSARAYLVIVAKNGSDDRPDLQTMRAFVASVSQGVVYDAGTWHHPIIALEETTDFACVETQIGGGSSLDCEIVNVEEQDRVVTIPKF